MVHMAKTGVVEITEFKALKVISESSFLEVSDAVQKNFLSKQKGYQKRSLLKGDGVWTDIVYWDSRESADAAAKAFMTQPDCRKFGAMIDQASLKSRIAEEIRRY